MSRLYIRSIVISLFSFFNTSAPQELRPAIGTRHPLSVLHICKVTQNTKLSLSPVPHSQPHSPIPHQGYEELLQKMRNEKRGHYTCGCFSGIIYKDACTFFLELQHLESVCTASADTYLLNYERKRTREGCKREAKIVPVPLDHRCGDCESGIPIDDPRRCGGNLGRSILAGPSRTDGKESKNEAKVQSLKEMVSNYLKRTKTGNSEEADADDSKETGSDDLRGIIQGSSAEARAEERKAVE
jgi:hypothetical protein